jgi:hypothetical protein
LIAQEELDRVTARTWKDLQEIVATDDVRGSISEMMAADERVL